MDSTRPILICFAVEEEARPFRLLPAAQGCRIAVTGMGRQNAELGIRRALTQGRPDLVVTAGFAGGLNPALRTGTVVFDADAGAGIDAALTGVGAVQARFHCAEQVAVTAVEKQALWKATAADAVEMESGVIREICRSEEIPSATVRVISDAATEDLPLDFNALMTPDCRINFFKLGLAVALSPGKIPKLLKFQKQTKHAARTLAVALAGAVEAIRSR